MGPWLLWQQAQKARFCGIRRLNVLMHFVSLACMLWIRHGHNAHSGVCVCCCFICIIAPGFALVVVVLVLALAFLVLAVAGPFLVVGQPWESHNP